MPAVEKLLRPKMGYRIPRRFIDLLDSEVVVIPDHILIGIPVIDAVMIGKLQELAKDKAFQEQFQVMIVPR